MWKSLRELDRSEAVRRRLKVVRNLFLERGPRNRELVFDSYSFAYPTLSIVYKAEGRNYVSTVDLRGIGAEQLDSITGQTFHRMAATIGMAMARLTS